MVLQVERCTSTNTQSNDSPPRATLEEQYTTTGLLLLDTGILDTGTALKSRCESAPCALVCGNFIVRPAPRLLLFFFQFTVTSVLGAPQSSGRKYTRCAAATHSTIRRRQDFVIGAIHTFPRCTDGWTSRALLLLRASAVHSGVSACGSSQRCAFRRINVGERERKGGASRSTQTAARL